MSSNILLVDDNPGMIQLMGRVLAGIGRCRFATSGAAALRQAREYPPDLVLLDAQMPEMDGYEVCRALKADPALRDIPVIFVTSHSDLEHELRGLAVGAADFIHKPISEPLLVARVKTQLRVKELTDELRRNATIDPLTDLANRRSFDEALTREWKRARREAVPIALLMIDVDHFKGFNDRYGHPAGDACLRAIATVLQQTSRRPADTVARYGGEEFALLLPNTPRAGAAHLAGRILSAVSGLAIPHASSPTADHVTVSVGVGVFDRSSPGWTAAGSWPPRAVGEADRGLAGPPITAEDLLQSADRALYAAKSAGRARAAQQDAGSGAGDGPALPQAGAS